MRIIKQTDTTHIKTTICINNIMQCIYFCLVNDDTLANTYIKKHRQYKHTHKTKHPFFKTTHIQIIAIVIINTIKNTKHKPKHKHTNMYLGERHQPHNKNYKI